MIQPGKVLHTLTFWYPAPSGGGGGGEGLCRARQWVGPWLLVGGRRLGSPAVRATLGRGTGA